MSVRSQIRVHHIYGLQHVRRDAALDQRRSSGVPGRVRAHQTHWKLRAAQRRRVLVMTQGFQDVLKMCWCILCPMKARLYCEMPCAHSGPIQSQRWCRSDCSTQQRQAGLRQASHGRSSCRLGVQARCWLHRFRCEQLVSASRVGARAMQGVVHLS